MLLGVQLSGEHPSLPKSECLACLNALGISHDLKLDWGRLLILDLDSSWEKLVELGSRLGLAHEIHQVLCICSNLAELMDQVSRLNLPPEDFGIRVECLGRELDQLECARKLGGIIKSKGLRVNLENPKLSFKLLGLPQGLVFCRSIAKIPKSEFSRRLPKYRPFNPPGSMHPKLARALVNLAQVPRGGKFLDPVCGTGGFLIEAGLIGAIPLGGDLNPKMLWGCRLNLEFFGIGAQLMRWDACSLPLKDRCMDGIAADLPYGRSHPIKSDLISALDEMLRVLKPGARAVVITHFPLQHEQMVESHIQRVHRSLTRYISVLRK